MFKNREGRDSAARFASLAVLVILLVGCSQAVVPVATPTVPPVAAPTDTPLPSLTFTPNATATLEPTATAAATVTPMPSPLPSLGVASDGFQAWCAPENYAGIQPTGPDAPAYARKLVVQGQTLQVPIPATYCVVAFLFNQPVPDGATLTFFDAKNAFLKLPLQRAETNPDEAWAVVKHTYVVNPPLWQVSYRLAVTDANGKELWNQPVVFAKPLPKACPFGGLPDPVTLWCTKTDPWEVEPVAHPTYPYDRAAWETANPK